MRRRGIIAVVAAACVTLAGVSVPALGSVRDRAGVHRVLTISPVQPRAGEMYRVAGRAPAAAARLVRLEVQGPNGSWRLKSRSISTRSGKFGFVWSSDRTQRLRVVAPRVARAPGQTMQPRWTSRVARVTPRSQAVTPTPTHTPSPSPSPTPSPTPAEPVSQTVTLQAPPFALEQQTATLTVSVAPAVVGRGVVLQRRDDGDGEAWTAVMSGLTSATGVVRFAVPTGAVGEVTYRAVAESGEGVLQGTSSPVPLPVVAGLPRVDVTTDGGAPIGANYVAGGLAIDPRGADVPAYSGQTRLRIRGNSTAYALVKLSYKVKLDAKAPLLGLPKSKDWVLLANFYDRTLLRTDLAFEISRRVDMAWTPSMVSVELWNNGHYAGVYQLGEGIEVDGDRVDIETPDVESDDFDPVAAATEGGYLLEGDFRDDTDPRFVTTRGLKLHLKEPQAEDFADPTDVSTYTAGVASWIQQAEDALYASTFRAGGYRQYLDVSSFIDWYFVNEIMKNHDSGFAASVWLYRDHAADGSTKLQLGPVWDFDQSAGARSDLGIGDPTGWFLRKTWPASAGSTMMIDPAGHWLNRLFEDPWFVAQVQHRWAELRSDLLTLPDYLSAQAAALAPAAQRNFTDLTGPPGNQVQLPIGWTFLEPEGIFFSSWPRTVQHVNYWLSDRLAWMDSELYGGS